MRKRVYHYVRYYLEIPKRVAEPSLGVQLQARRLAECIIIAPAGRSDLFSTIEKLARQNGRKGADGLHVRLHSPSNRRRHNGNT